MKNFTLTILMLMIFGSASFSQYTATLPTATASPGENVAVNLNVTNFTNIGSIQLCFKVNPAVLSYEGNSGFSQSGLMVNVTHDTIRIIWTSSTPHTWAPGTLLTLNFKYNGLTSNLSFLPAMCEVASFTGGMPTILTGTFTNGSVGPYMSNTEQAQLGSVYSVSSSMVTVPLTYTGLPGTSAAAITQYISYDAAKLTYVSVTGTNLLSTGITATAVGGVIHLTWTNLSGALINTSGSQFNLNFFYTGNAAAYVNFSTGCIISAPVTAANIPVTYNNGFVLHSGVITSFASLAPALTNAAQGQNIDVPLTLTGMPAGINNFTLNLTFDSPRLSFVGVYNAMYPVTYNSPTAGNIAITYINLAAPSVNGQFLVLRFRYDGPGTAAINFGSSCLFSTGIPVQVGYTNGSVAPAPVANKNANIAVVSATSGSNVDVPVTFSGALTSVGAVTLNIGFDASKLTFLTLSGNPHNVSFTLKDNIIKIGWFDVTPIDITTGDFVTLRFQYHSTSGDPSALITFNDGCVISNAVGTTIPINWIDGGVNTKFMVSGTLKYDNHPPYSNTLAGFTVNLRTDDINSDLVATSVTDVNGHYEFMAPNGNYKLETLQPDSLLAPWFATEQSANLIIYYAFGYNLITDKTPLKLQASDVNLDTFITEDDANLIIYRVYGYVLPEYTAPEWVFQTPSIVVNGASLPNQDFFGICSGDVAGEGPIF